MDASAVSVDVNKVAKDLTMTVRVTGANTWRVKLLVASLLIRLASWVLGCEVKVEYE